MDRPPPRRQTKDAPPILPPPDFGDDLEVYPAIFPVPDRQPYAYSVDMGLVRSEFAAGNTRQRRAYSIMPHMLSLAFHMRVEELFLWQSWVNQFAFTWIHCPVSTMYAGQPPDPANMRYEILRFASDLAVAMDGFDWIAVTVTAELSNDAHATAPPIGLGGWIVAGLPTTPAADWEVAGTPAAPAPDWILAGTPDNPASF